MLPFSFLSFVGGIRGALSVAVTLLICWNLHKLSTWNHQNQLESLAVKLRAECADNQRKIDEVTHDYTTRLKGINNRHANAISRLLRHEAGKCDTSPGMDDGATDTDRIYRAAGVIDLGRAAEENTAKLIACQGFVKSISQ